MYNRSQTLSERYNKLERNSSRKFFKKHGFCFTNYVHVERVSDITLEIMANCQNIDPEKQRYITFPRNASYIPGPSRSLSEQAWEIAVSVFEAYGLRNKTDIISMQSWFEQETNLNREDYELPVKVDWHPLANMPIIPKTSEFDRSVISFIKDLYKLDEVSRELCSKKFIQLVPRGHGKDLTYKHDLYMNTHWSHNTSDPWTLNDRIVGGGRFIVQA